MVELTKLRKVRRAPARRRRLPQSNQRIKREVVDHIKGIILKYGGHLMPDGSPNLKVTFSRQLPPDVIAEMHPYYDTIDNKPSGTEIWFNVPLITKTIGQYFDKHERKAVAGTVVHELCHACHFVEDPTDYEKRMHSGYHYKKCFQKAAKKAKWLKKYDGAINDDIVVEI